MPLSSYISSINARYKLGNATEHAFRGDLQQLIESLVPEIREKNEPKSKEKKGNGTCDILYISKG
jgi:hypothetical protein